MDDKERLRQELQDRKYELNREFEALKDSPLVQQMKRKAAVVPISAGLFSLVSLAVARRVPTTRPILFGSGTSISCCRIDPFRLNGNGRAVGRTDGCILASKTVLHGRSRRAGSGAVKVHCTRVEQSRGSTEKAEINGNITRMKHFIQREKEIPS